jgi:hypothetical protein
MQFVRKTGLFFLVFLLFTGSIGINVFAHFCSQAGTDYSYILPPDSCETEMAAALPACCHAPVQIDHSDKQFKNNCCQEAVSTFKISTDFLQKFSSPLVWHLVPQQPKVLYAFAETVVEAPLVLGFAQRPPPKPGREILVLQQTFRI